MAKGVLADVANAQSFRHRFNEHPHDRHRPVRLFAAFRAGTGELANTQSSGFRYGVILYQASNSSIGFASFRRAT
jgi:hypothetical protein